MKVFVDQLHRKITLPSPPKRIVSLVPSQTELLYDMGLGQEVVGITKFCIHPKAWYKSKPRVGGTKKVNFKAIEKLNPDLIIANKEENSKEDIEQLIEKYPVWISDIYTLKDALAMILALGEITQKVDSAQAIVKRITSEFEELKPIVHTTPPRKILYLIWHNPIISVAANTFIDEMLCQNNFTNVLQNKNRYPELTKDELVMLKPEIVFLSSEPFPFKEKHLLFYQELLPDSKIVLVNGELFSWYGSRLMKSPKYFLNLAHQLQ